MKKRNVIQRLPVDVADAIRRNYGLQPGDTSADEEISKLNSSELFRRFCVWHGLLGGWSEILEDALDDIRKAKRKKKRKVEKANV